jgi:hypothetical protein
MPGNTRFFDTSPWKKDGSLQGTVEGRTILPDSFHPEKPYYRFWCRGGLYAHPLSYSNSNSFLEEINSSPTVRLSLPGEGVS